jgi:c-di-GMP-binding flagellar brake protein YcgR
MQERRSSKRWGAYFKARIVFNNRSSVLDCTVRDISDTGAGISFAGILPLPKEFGLRSQPGAFGRMPAQYGTEAPITVSCSGRRQKPGLMLREYTVAAASFRSSAG